MKKTELKALLKPLIKECIKEVMFEDGVLSGIVSEVATGMGGVQIVETRHREQPKAKRKRVKKQENFAEMRQESLQEQRREIDAHKKKLLDAIGNETYNGINLFEGTAPLKSDGSSTADGAPQGALANMDSSDPGVDISNLFGKVGRNWQAHLNAEK